MADKKKKILNESGVDALYKETANFITSYINNSAPASALPSGGNLGVVIPVSHISTAPLHIPSKLPNNAPIIQKSPVIPVSTTPSSTPPTTSSSTSNSTTPPTTSSSTSNSTTPPTTSSSTSNNYNFVSGVLYLNGSPYSGTYKGSLYVNGVASKGAIITKTSITTPPQTGYVFKSGLLYLNGSLYSGVYKGYTYNNGALEVSHFTTGSISGVGYNQSANTPPSNTILINGLS